MKRFLTDSYSNLASTHVLPHIEPRDPEMRLVKVYPHVKFQKVVGFGAALTESAAYVYSRMDEELQDQFIDLCFGARENRYSLCRTTIQSCDFSLGSRAYLDKRDPSLSGFDIGKDRDFLLPLIKRASEASGELQFLASPWSPPAWAKTNRSMLRGGKLRSDDFALWADMIARYLQEYRAEGVQIGRLTLQNEPNAIQTWESCLFSAKREARFAITLRDRLDRAGLDEVKLFIWDHNKEGMFDRASACLSDPACAEAIDGVAFHWYSGDHFEAVAATSLLIGDRELIFTEGCDSYSAGDAGQELPHAEHYAHEIMGDLKNGAQGAIDWNILLDSRGGPNHVGNYCDAPIMYDEDAGKLNVRLPFRYLAHFSRFIRPGARRLLTTSYTDDLEACAFENTDGSNALVVLNRTDREIGFNLVSEGGPVAEHITYPTELPAHSIATYLWR